MNHLTFSPSDDAEKIEDAKIYLADLGVSDEAALFQSMIQTIYADDPQTSAQMLSMGGVPRRQRCWISIWSTRIMTKCF